MNTEWGKAYPGWTVMTGSNASGTAASNHCNNWNVPTSTDLNSYHSQEGHAGSLGSRWIFDTTIDETCSQSRRLYCFNKNRNPPNCSLNATQSECGGYSLCAWDTIASQCQTKPYYCSQISLGQCSVDTYCLVADGICVPKP